MGMGIGPGPGITPGPGPGPMPTGAVTTGANSSTGSSQMKKITNSVRGTTTSVPLVSFLVGSIGPGPGPGPGRTISPGPGPTPMRPAPPPLSTDGAICPI